MSQPASIDTDPSMTTTAYFQRAWSEIADACTRCGKCVEVCPVTPTLPAVAAVPPAEVISGLFDFMGGGPLSEPTRRFGNGCNSCGVCIPACPENVNPRRMVLLSLPRMSAVDKPAPDAFQKMARATRIFVAMQLLPNDVLRMLKPPKARKVDVVFHGGCNPVRTPNLLFNLMTLLDALDVNYEFMGGPSSCCGVVHSKWEGDLKRGEKTSEVTLRRFGEFKPKQVIEWCPTCRLHFNETLEGYRQVEFSIDHATGLLRERSSTLRSLFTTPVQQRVIVHTHQGMADVGQNVVELLSMVPGLTIVDVIEEPGYTCGVSGHDRSPELKAQARPKTLEAMKKSGADALVSLYHSCHRQLLGEGRVNGFKVINYTDPLVRACGLDPWPDTMEPMAGRNDWANLVREVMPLLMQNHIDIDPESLLAVMPELFAGAEWKGGLCSFAASVRASSPSASGSTR